MKGNLAVAVKITNPHREEISAAESRTFGTVIDIFPIDRAMRVFVPPGDGWKAEERKPSLC